MSCPVNLTALPSGLFESVLTPENIRGRGSMNSLTPLSFPKSRSALWDGSPAGQKLRLQLCARRKPRLVLMEKALRLAQRHARQSNKPRLLCFFLGSVSVDADEEGVTVTLDRFDPGRDQAGSSGRTPSSLLPGDVLVPCLFSSQSETSDTVVQSEAELHHCFKALQQCVSSRQTLDLGQLIKFRGHVVCCQQYDAAVFSLSWSFVCPSISVDVQPVRSVPIIPTALLRSLTSFNRPLPQAASRQRGFLTMDQTRKLLLLLESDPKASTLPLVGLWLSGVTHVYNPQVWAWCLRFLFSSSLQERVLSESGCFLLVLFGSTHRAPQFFQCRRPGSGLQLDYQLLTASQSVTLYQQAVCVEGQTLRCELGSEDLSRQTQVFRDAMSSFNSAVHPAAGLSVSDQDSGVEDEDLSPRPSPSPHLPAQQSRRVQPSVPELSLLIDSSFSSNPNIWQNPGSAHKPPMPAPADRQSVPHTGNTASNSLAPTTAPHPHLHSTPHSNLQQPCTCCSSHTYNCTTIYSSSPTLHPAPAASPHHRNNTPPCSRHQTPPPSSFNPASPPSSQHHSNPAPSLHHQTSPPPLSSFHPALSSKHHHTASSAPSVHRQTPPPHALRSAAASPTPAVSPHHHNTPPPPSHHRTPPPTKPHPPSPSSHHQTLSPPSENHQATPPSRHHSPPHFSTHLAPSPSHSPVSLPSLHHHHTPPPSNHLSGPPAPSPSLLTPYPCPSCVNQCCDLVGGGASTDTYQLLLHQDRQLRLLQAQVQMLLEAQGKLQVDTPTPRSTASIAVGTGASLFWGDPWQPLPHQEDKALPTSSPSPTSSPRPLPVSSTAPHTDLSFIRPAEDGDIRDQETAGHSLSGLQSPVLGESVSMFTPADQQQSFYQHLKNQLTSRLQESDSKQEEKRDSRRSSLSAAPDSSQSSSSSSSSSSRRRQHSLGGDPVVSATLRQLQQLGVNVDEDDLTESERRKHQTVESSSTLAAINPAAVLSRLSVSEPSASTLFPGASVDLSLEANAIALRYLSDSQLSRLSLGGHTPLPGPASSCNSLLSPSNMSMATRKYMRRYGLIEEEDDEDEEQGINAQEASTRPPLGEAMNVKLLPQSQLIRDLKPKMQLLADSNKPHTADKENCSSGRPSLVRASSRQTEGSVGNILDLSRLRQLPKLF
ncbi:SCL-interrupting locus protein homolog isoform X2 [Notolabrus celidotus]|uniref:SCL-interrupting locus protein homolog isoform X2 n=1 Tax=Notolabrus celidotus TaxID=1203425 RepID=UPI00148F49E0|nr:SCL-interrupting locus protein homolog isoform X2 [Notolabrus celidotus]